MHSLPTTFTPLPSSSPFLTAADSHEAADGTFLGGLGNTVKDATTKPPSNIVKCDICSPRTYEINILTRKADEPTWIIETRVIFKEYCWRVENSVAIELCSSYVNISMADLQAGTEVGLSRMISITGLVWRGTALSWYAFCALFYHPHQLPRSSQM